MTYAVNSNILASDYPTVVGSFAAQAANVLPSWSQKNEGLNVFGDFITRANIGTTYGWATAKSNKGFSAGKYYWEVTIESAANPSTNNRIIIGIIAAASALNVFVGNLVKDFGYYNNGGGTNVQNYYTGNVPNTYGSGTFGAGSVIGVLVDLTAKTLTFYKDNVSQGVISIATVTGTIHPAVSLYDRDNSVSVNLGQRDFVYAIPSGASVLAPVQVSQVGSLFGTGYGDWGYQQTSPAFLNPIAGTAILAAAWNNISTALDKVTNHTGGDNSLTPSVIDLVANKAIKAYVSPHPSSFARSAARLSRKRHTAAIAGMTVYSPVTYGLRLTYGGVAWGSGVTNGLRCQARYSFTNEEEARKFFNTGGELRISLTHPNVSTTQNSNWNTVCSSIGTIKIGANSVVLTGTVGAAIANGYYQFTTTAKTVFDGTNIGTGAYSANDVTVTVTSSNAPGTNGGTGYQLNVTVTLADQHVNAFSDTVNNGTYADFGYYAATTYLTSPIPTVTQVVAWVATTV